MIELRVLNEADRATWWVEHYYALEGLNFNDTVKAGLSKLVANTAYGWVFEAVLDGTPFGYAILTRAFDHEVGGEYGILTDLFLLESHRGQGLGTAILRQVFEFARDNGFRSLDLYVLDHNKAARKFYERLGFRELDGRRPMTIELAETSSR